MSIKDILVHLDGGERDAVVVAAASGLAQRFQARLTGLFARLDSHKPSVIARRESETLAEFGNAAARAFEAMLANSGIDGRFWRLGHGSPDHVLSESVICARFADLIVVGQTIEGAHIPPTFVEQLVLQSGRPCLVMPCVGQFPTIGTNVLVAWNGSREASRAVHDALPFITAAKSVEIITVDHPGGAPHDRALPPCNICDHLAAHGTVVRREHLVGEDTGAMDLILSRSFEVGGDLLVLGGHAGYHLPFVKETGTQYMLQHMTLPVLMSN